MLCYGEVIENKYKVVDFIGEGGMSKVYLAEDINLGKLWVLKVIRRNVGSYKDSILLESLLREINIMKSLDSSGIPRVVDVFEHAKLHIIVMDYIKGENLKTYIEQNGPIDEIQSVKWMKEISRILVYLHRNDVGIVYGDLKPGNIILKENGSLSIIDFGAARLLNKCDVECKYILGTKGYAAPEQHFGYIDARADIYALGKTIIYLLTLEDVTKSDNGLLKTLKSTVSYRFYKIIKKSIETDLSKRYGNVGELLEDLQILEDKNKFNIRKIRKSTKIFYFGIVFLCIGLITGISQDLYYEYLYNKAISISRVLSSGEKLDSYYKAIEYKPKSFIPYRKIIEVYEDKGIITRDDDEDLIRLYKLIYKNFDKRDISFAELNFRLGSLYFNYFSKDGKLTNLEERAVRAYYFFEENHKHKNYYRNFDKLKLSEGYFEVCRFYKNYILAMDNAKDATRVEYEHLLKIANSTMESMDKESSYSKLILYESILSFIYDQRYNLVDVKIDKKVVNKLVSKLKYQISNNKPKTKNGLKIQENLKERISLYEIELNEIFN